MRSLSNFVQNITKNVIRKHGFATAKIIFDWEIIVGPELAKYTTPVKVSYPTNKNSSGTLHIKTISAQSPIIQQMQHEIIEKIATYFGFRAVEKIKLIQTHDLPEDDEEKPIPLKAEDLSALDKSVSEVEDKELQDILKRIGTRILEKKQ